MEPPSATARGYAEIPLAKTWTSTEVSPALRPDVSFSDAKMLNNLGQNNSSQFMPNRSAEHMQFSGDWANIFSAPLNPTVFAALAANGVISTPVTQPSSLPSSSFHQNFTPSSSRQQLPNIDVMVQPSNGSQWAESPLSYHPPSAFPQRPTIHRTTSSPKVKANAQFQQRNITKAGSVDERQRRHNQMRRIDPGILPFDPALNAGLVPTLENPSAYPIATERSMAGIPPSLWMSPALPAPAMPLRPVIAASTRSSMAQSPISPTSPASDSKSLFTDIFSDDLFSVPGPSQTASPFTSPRISGSPDLQSSVGLDDDPEKLAKEDPLATQVWKMYTKTKATLPHAQRMENLTWRMMALALKKKKEDEENRSTAHHKVKFAKPTEAAKEAANEPQHSDPKASDERGRRIDKGKAKVRVVGFDGTNQDGPQAEDEWVYLCVF